jgi:hypothetical protein
MIFLLFLLSPFFPSLLSSPISSSQLLQDFTSLSLTTQITLKFLLTNPLPQGGYLRIRLPFSIDKDGSGMSATWWNSGEDPLCNNQEVSNPAVIQKSTESGSKTYFLQFFTRNDLVNTISLPSKTLLFLRINFAQSPNLPDLSTTSSVVFPPIQLATVAFPSESALSIDENPTFGILAYNTQINSLYIQTPGIYSDPVGSISKAELKIRPTQSLFPGQRILIVFSNPKFIFQSSGDPSTSADSYSSEASYSSQMTFFITKNLQANEDLKISFKFKYPYALESTSLSIILLNQANNFVLGNGYMGQNFAIATKIAWDPENSQVFAGWGVDLTKAKPPFRIYRNGATQKIYNNLRFRAGLKNEIPKTQRMRVVLTFLNTVIIQSSSFSCSISSLCQNYINAAGAYIVICENVYGLKDIYFNVKASIAYNVDDTPKALESSFVKIEAFPYDSLGNLLSSSLIDEYFLSCNNNFFRLNI